MSARTRFTAKIALVVGMAAAVAAPVASAQVDPFEYAKRINDQERHQKYIAGYTDFPNALRYAPPGTIKVETPTLSAATEAPGFDWGDAGVGAGVTAAAALLLGGVSVGLRRKTRLSIS